MKLLKIGMAGQLQRSVMHMEPVHVQLQHYHQTNHLTQSMTWLKPEVQIHYSEKSNHQKAHQYPIPITFHQKCWKTGFRFLKPKSAIVSTEMDSISYAKAGQFFSQIIYLGWIWCPIKLELKIVLSFWCFNSFDWIQFKDVI